LLAEAHPLRGAGAEALDLGVDLRDLRLEGLLAHLALGVVVALVDLGAGLRALLREADLRLPEVALLLLGEHLERALEELLLLEGVARRGELGVPLLHRRLVFAAGGPGAAGAGGACTFGRVKPALQGARHPGARFLHALDHLVAVGLRDLGDVARGGVPDLDLLLGA
jgi:hypothetical protein